MIYLKKHKKIFSVFLIFLFIILYGCSSSKDKTENESVADEELDNINEIIDEDTEVGEFSPEPLFEETSSYSVKYSNNNDETDIYFPAIKEESAQGPFPVALLLQGGRVDKKYYSKYAHAVASYGFIVVVPNHFSSFEFSEGYKGEGLFSELSQIPATIEFIAYENSREDSPLKGLADSSRMGLLGHSYGSAAAIAAIQSFCQYPFCPEGESFSLPSEVKAAALSGINSRPRYDPTFLGVQPINNQVPLAIINGDLEGNALVDDTKATYELIKEGPKALVLVKGSNHYGMCDENNAPGPLEGDPNKPEIDQEMSIKLMAKWAGLFLRAHVCDDSGAESFIHEGSHKDSDVEVYADPPGTNPEIGPDIGLEWIKVEGGSFNQGSVDGNSNEQPMREVKITDFEMLKTEVTVSQYSACIAVGRCTPPDKGENSNYYEKDRGDHPVNFIDWRQAVNFCDWIRSRLPTESEWEYAATNMGKDLFPWGEEKASCKYAVMRDENGVGCGKETTWPVCSKIEGKTENGLCDMIGNVWEWTIDWFHDTYEGAPVDGTARIDPRGKYRVLRGGALSYDETWNRSTVRNDHGNPTFRVYTVGFRCVRGSYVEGDYLAPFEDPDDEENVTIDCGDSCDWSCNEKQCVNVDGNTHSDCDCDADYCVPDISGLEFAGLTALTCTARGCDPDDEKTCPEGLVCRIIPPFVIDMMKEEGINMPSRICGKAN